jgi:dihydroxyacetone kinase-like predicted kinase
MLIDRIRLVSALADFRADLERFRTRLNQINTLPVPDHDTGNNLLATITQIMAAATLDSADGVQYEKLNMYEAFGNSGMLIGAWLEGAERAIAAPVSIGQVAAAAAREVEQIIVCPQPGLFLDYAIRSADLLGRVGPDVLHDETRIIVDDLRMLLIETASEAPELHQLVDSGSAGLYFLLKRLLFACPDNADENLFESWAQEPAAGVNSHDELVEFLFTVEDAPRTRILAILCQFSVESVMLGRSSHGGIRAHCHGPKYIAAGLYDSLATCSRVSNFHIRQVYPNAQDDGDRGREVGFS